MSDWPHAPLHRLDEAGAYFVTGATYRKAHHFRDRQRLTMLQAHLLSLARDYGWHLQAWAVFSNHYHFVAWSDSGGQSLSALIRRLHSITAREVNQLDGTPARRVWFQYWETP
ncbi:MAG: transposase [Sphaerobacter sp.]|nr:transposase [Sphaerobacter sp.]